MYQKLQNIEKKSLIVHLPIDLVYFNNFFPQKYKTDDDDNNLDSISLENTQDYYTNFETEKNSTFFYANEQKWEKRISENISQKYYGQKNKSPVHCWYCSRKIEWQVCGLPEKYKKKIFYVKGFFCTLNCVLAYNNNCKENEQIIQERDGLIRMMHKLSFPDDTEPLKPSPPKESLKKYGGTLTYQDFHLHNKEVNIINLPKKSIFCGIDENIPISNFC